MYNPIYNVSVKIPFLQFPHFPRIKNASPLRYVSYVLWLTVVGFILFNVTVDQLSYGTEKKLRFSALRNDDVSSLEQLARYSVPYNASYAKEQFSLAQDRMGSVLGIQNSPLHTWEKLQQRREQIQQEIKSWETLYTLHPDYRFTAVKLAALYRQLGDKPKSEYYLDKALTDAPHDPLAQMIKEEKN